MKPRTTAIDLIDAAFELAVKEDRRFLAYLLDMARLEIRLETKAQPSSQLPAAHGDAPPDSEPQ